MEKNRHMKFVYEYKLKEYMEQTGKKNIVVEVVTINHSEVEISELHVHFVDERQTDIFKKKYRYRGVQTEMGEVLLPHYKLNYDEEVVFGLKKFLCFRTISYKGITQ